MFCALTTRPALTGPCVVSTPTTRAPSRRRPVTLNPFPQRRAQSPRRARIGGEREVRVRVTGGGLPADDRMVAEVEQRMNALRLVGGDLVRVNSGVALKSEGGAKRVGAFPIRSEQHQAAGVESAIGLGVVEIAREIPKDRERGLRERDIGGNGVMRAHDARRLRRRAAAQRAALEQQHAAGAEAGEMQCDRRSDDSAADHDCVETFHGVRLQPGEVVSLSCQRESTARDSHTVAMNSAIPAAAIRNSAANSRGMLSCIPASRIW